MSKSASSSDPSDIWSQQDCFNHCEQFITSYAKDTELFDDSEDSLCCNYAQLTDGYSCDLVVSKTVTNVDPGTQDSGESSKAKLFTPDVAPEKTSIVPAWLAIIMTTFDMGSNMLVPAAGYYLEKYLEVNYSWDQNQGVIMIPTAIAAVYLLSGDLIELLSVLGAFSGFQSDDLNKLAYFSTVAFYFEDMLFSVFVLVVSSFVLFDWYNGDTKDTEYYLNIVMFVLSIVMIGWDTF